MWTGPKLEKSWLHKGACLEIWLQLSQTSLTFYCHISYQQANTTARLFFTAGKKHDHGAPQFFDRTLSRKPQKGSRSKPLHTPKQVFGGRWTPPYAHHLSDRHSSFKPTTSGFYLRHSWSFSSGDVDSIWLLTSTGRRGEIMQLRKIMESLNQRADYIWSVTRMKTRKCYSKHAFSTGKSPS